jgi:hypothetical protein
MNQLGVDVLLRRDQTLYQQVCPAVLADCSRPYTSLEPAQQAMIRGAVVKLTDATCPDCEFGFDLNIAKQSVSIIAQVLVANCQVVDTILSQAIVPDEDVDAATATAAVATIQAGGENPSTEYEDLWRYTLLSYHSGPSCFQEAVIAARKDKLDRNWNAGAAKIMSMVLWIHYSHSIAIATSSRMRTLSCRFRRSSRQIHRLLP